MAFLDEPPPKPLWRVISVFVIGWSSVFLTPTSCVFTGMVAGGGTHNWTTLEKLGLWTPALVAAAGVFAFLAHGMGRQWPFWAMLISFTLYLIGGQMLR